MGFDYSIQKDKYYGKIMLSGTDKTIRLSDHDTPEEAFKEYKIMKVGGYAFSSGKI